MKIDPSWKPGSFNEAIGRMTSCGAEISPRTVVSVGSFSEFVAADSPRIIMRKVNKTVLLIFCMRVLGSNYLYFFQINLASVRLDVKFSLPLACDAILELTSGLGEKSASIHTYLRLK